MFKRLLRKDFYSEYFQFFKELLIIFYPLFFTSFLQYIILLTPIIVAGQLEKIQMDGVALAISTIHIFGTSVGYGLQYACDTLFSQAFGSPDKKKTGFYLQKSICVSVLFLFPIIAILFNIDHFLLLIGQDPRICEICSSFILFYLPAFPLQYLFFILSRYMQNQDKLWPPFVSVLVGNIFNVIFHYLFIFQWKFTYRASAVCIVLTFLLMVLISLLYIIISKFYKRTWPGFTFTVFYDWGDFLKLAIPGIGYSAIEQINWEAEIFLAGYMGIVPMAVHSVLAQTGTLTASTYDALGVSVNVKIGQYIGANESSKAKKVGKVGVVMILILALTIGFTISIIRNLWTRLYTSDIVVGRMAADIVAFYPVYYIPENINFVLASILRACAKHLLTMNLAIGCMYLIGLPLAACLGFLAHLEVVGLWIGNSTGLTTLMIVYSVNIWLLNWDKVLAEAKKRLDAANYDEKNESLENHPLLESAEMEHSPKNSITPDNKAQHLRIPSHGITNSYNLYRIRNSMALENRKFKIHQSRKSIIMKRTLSLLICIIILMVGITTHIIYRPNYEMYKANSTNST